MKIIDADKFLGYLIFSKHIDGLTCGEVKEAIEMCKVDDVLDEIRAEIDNKLQLCRSLLFFSQAQGLADALEIIDKYKADKENEE